MNPSFKDFKSWYNQENKPKIVGESVVTKIVNTSTLEKHIKASNEDLNNIKTISEYFLKNGGKILKQEKDIYLIETNEGNFRINKKYIKLT